MPLQTCCHYSKNRQGIACSFDNATLKASNNGFILLHNMQLSRIEILIHFSNTITTVDGKAVQSRINGIEVIAVEVIALPPQDIIRIKYHDNPDMRYGNVAAVIDYSVLSAAENQTEAYRRI